MIFTVTSFNKDMDLYEITSDAGEKKWVSGLPVVMVILQGYKFTNAELTKKGFAVKSNGRTKYFQVNMSKEIYGNVVKFLEAKRKAEEAKKAAIAEAIKKPVATTVPKAPSSNNVHTPIQGRNNQNSKIYFRGDTYTSPEQLCRKFNRDPEEFKDLYRKGYSAAEALGLRALRPINEVTPRSTIDKTLDSMARQRGE